MTVCHYCGSDNTEPHVITGRDDELPDTYCLKCGKVSPNPFLVEQWLRMREYDENRWRQLKLAMMEK